MTYIPHRENPEDSIPPQGSQPEQAQQVPQEAAPEQVEWKVPQIDQPDSVAQSQPVQPSEGEVVIIEGEVSEWPTSDGQPIEGAQPEWQPAETPASRTEPQGQPEASGWTQPQTGQAGAGEVPNWQAGADAQSQGAAGWQPQGDQPQGAANWQQPQGGQPSTASTAGGWQPPQNPGDVDASQGQANDGSASGGQPAVASWASGQAEQAGQPEGRIGADEAPSWQAAENTPPQGAPNWQQPQGAPQGAPNWQQPQGAADWQQPQNPAGTGAPQGAPNWQQPQGAPQGQAGWQQPPSPPYPAQQPYAQSCLSAAWSDIRESNGWLGKSAVLGLINCVPILNFMTAGYALNWSREVPYGVKTAMPSKYCSGRNFEIGFYAFVISLVIGIVTGIVASLVGLVPFVGALAAAAAYVVAWIAEGALNMRMGMSQSIGGGFAIGDAFRALKRNWSQAILATVAPSLISAAISMLLSLVFIAILVGGAMPTLMGMSGADLSDVSMAFLFGSVGWFGVIVAILGIVVIQIANAVCQVLMYRAMAHWVARYAPEWTLLIN